MVAASSWLPQPRWIRHATVISSVRDQIKTQSKYLLALVSDQFWANLGEIWEEICKVLGSAGTYFYSPLYKQLPENTKTARLAPLKSYRDEQNSHVQDISSRID